MRGIASIAMRVAALEKPKNNPPSSLVLFNLNNGLPAFYAADEYGFRVEHPEDVQPTIEKANGIDDRPVVVDFRTDAQEKVFPMVAAGQSNDDIIVHPSQRATNQKVVQ